MLQKKKKNVWCIYNFYCGDGIVVYFVSITDVSFVDEWGDNQVLSFYANIYCYYKEIMDDLLTTSKKIPVCFGIKPPSGA
jgi:hypothetical protein